MRCIMHVARDSSSKGCNTSQQVKSWCVGKESRVGHHRHPATLSCRSMHRSRQQACQGTQQGVGLVGQKKVWILKTLLSATWSLVWRIRSLDFTTSNSPPSPPPTLLSTIPTSAPTYDPGISTCPRHASPLRPHLPLPSPSQYPLPQAPPTYHPPAKL